MRQIRVPTRVKGRTTALRDIACNIHARMDTHTHTLKLAHTHTQQNSICLENSAQTCTQARSDNRQCQAADPTGPD